jgi:hypothetical protein
MRAPRRADDRAAVPADHQPHRPGWTCAVDGNDWPCAVYREHAWTSLDGDRSAVASLMAGWYPQMVVELGEERVAHDRLFAWARHPVGRPAGGPL